MGTTIIDLTVAARIAQAADTGIDALGSAIVDGNQVLAVDDGQIARAIEEAAYSDLGLDLGRSETCNVEGKTMQVWKGAPTAFAA